MGELPRLKRGWLCYSAYVKVLLIGATGRTGRLVLERLLAEGYEVTVLARHPQAIASERRSMTILKGDATDAADVRQALTGQEAIISTIGVRSLGKTNLETAFMQALLPAASNPHFKRFVNLSAWGAGDTRTENTYLLMKLARATLLKNLYMDKDRGETLLFVSTLPYVNVRPGRLTNGKARGGVGASLDGRGLRHNISRADVADFLVAQLTEDTWLRQSPLIGYKK